MAFLGGGLVRHSLLCIIFLLVYFEANGEEERSNSCAKSTFCAECYVPTFAKESSTEHMLLPSSS